MATVSRGLPPQPHLDVPKREARELPADWQAGRPEASRALLERGAETGMRANLRKFLDWREQPRWHEARNVTAVEWARMFPDPDWVNSDALRLLEQR